MQVRKFLHLLIITSSMLFITNSLVAQRIAENRNGEHIIIYQDGSWEKYDKENAKHKDLLKQHRKEKTGSSSSVDKATKDKLVEKGAVSDGMEKLLNDLKTKKSIAQEELNQAIESENTAKLERAMLEDELNELIEGEDDSAIFMLEKQIEDAKAIEKQAKRERKIAKREFKSAKKDLLLATPKGLKGKTNNKVAKTKNRKDSKMALKERKKNKEIEEQTTTLTEEMKSYSKYNMKTDVMFFPPQDECSFSFDGVDEFLGKKRRDVTEGIFFNHTDEEMRKYLRHKEYMECKGNFTQIEGGVLILNLYISIATRDASRTFGKIQKGSLLTIKFIDDSKIKLASTKEVKGKYDSVTERHTYVVQYIVSSGQEKAMTKGEVDKIRMIWETGYEDYEIYDVDFLKNQLWCLKNN